MRASPQPAPRARHRWARSSLQRPIWRARSPRPSHWRTIAFLQIDLSDPAFHDLALAQVRATLAGYEVLLAAAVDAGELIPCDLRRLARAIQAMSGGSLINWAIDRTGGVLDWVRADLDALLAPYRRAPAEYSGTRAGPRTRHGKQQVTRPGTSQGGRRD